jgi:hypothetical protein
MNHATKLPISIDLSQFREELLAPHKKYIKLQKYARGMSGDHCGSETKYVENADYFIDQLPAGLLEKERPFLFMLELAASDAENPVLPAHVDINKTCGINVYLDAHGEVTQFYHWNSDSRQSEYVEEFCASVGDVWLMDTSVPHLVNLVPKKVRRILTFSFTKLKYAEVLSCFATN